MTSGGGGAACGGAPGSAVRRRRNGGCPEEQAGWGRGPSPALLSPRHLGGGGSWGSPSLSRQPCAAPSRRRGGGGGGRKGGKCCNVAPGRQAREAANPPLGPGASPRAEPTPPSYRAAGRPAIPARGGENPGRGPGGRIRPKGRRGRSTHLSPPCPSSITWDRRPYAPTCPAAGEAARLSRLGQGRRGLRRRRPLRSRLRLLRCGRSCRVPPPLAGSAGLCRAVPSSFVFLHPRPPPINYCSLSITPPGCAGLLALPPPPKTPGDNTRGGLLSGSAGRKSREWTRAAGTARLHTQRPALRFLPPRHAAPAPPAAAATTTAAAPHWIEIRIRVFPAAPRRVSPGSHRHRPRPRAPLHTLRRAAPARRPAPPARLPLPRAAIGPRRAATHGQRLRPRARRTAQVRSPPAPRGAPGPRSPRRAAAGHGPIRPGPARVWPREGGCYLALTEAAAARWELSPAAAPACPAAPRGCGAPAAPSAGPAGRPLRAGASPER